MTGHSGWFLCLLKKRDKVQQCSESTELHFPPNSRQYFVSKNAVSPSSSSPYSYLYHTPVQSIKRKITVKVRWLKVKSHGPRIRAHRCGVFGRLMRAAPWLRRRFNLNQYAIEQGSSDWLIILVSLGILIITFQSGELDSLDCLQTVNRKMS